MRLAWSRSEIEVRQCEKQEIQIFSFLWASGNSWLQSHADCKTTTLWAESLRDAFYAISFYSSRDESPFILNFATECLCWVEKCSCGDHLRFKALSNIAVGDDRCYGYHKHWDCAHQGMMFSRWAEELRNQSLSTDRTKYCFLGLARNKGVYQAQAIRNCSLFHMYRLKSNRRLRWYSCVQSLEDFFDTAECRAEHAMWNSSSFEGGLEHFVSPSSVLGCFKGWR